MGMTGNDCISAAVESQFLRKRSARPHGRGNVFGTAHCRDLVRGAAGFGEPAPATLLNTV
jgi:hypothetical protein